MAKILVVEHQVVAAMLMVSTLLSAGVDVTAASGSLEGMDLATTRRFDLIVLDAGLPGINGFEICRELKQRHIAYRTPIVFVGRSSGEERRHAFEVGAADYLAQPIKATEFLYKIVSLAKEPAPTETTVA